MDYIINKTSNQCGGISRSHQIVTVTFSMWLQVLSLGMIKDF
jgi:hypothetical protein